MSTPTTVQPSRGQKLSEDSDQLHSQYVARLVECGGDESSAISLVNRLTRDVDSDDKFEKVAINAFIDSIVTLSASGGRLTSVS